MFLRGLEYVIERVAYNFKTLSSERQTFNFLTFKENGKLPALNVSYNFRFYEVLK